MILRFPENGFNKEDVDKIVRETGLNAAQVTIWGENICRMFPQYNDRLEFLFSNKTSASVVKDAMSDYVIDYTPEQLKTFKITALAERIKKLEEQVATLTNQNHELLVKVDRQKRIIKGGDNFALAKDILDQAETLYDKIEATAERSAKRARIDWKKNVEHMFCAWLNHVFYTRVKPYFHV